MQKKEVKKNNKNKRILSLKSTSILYFICGFCWIVSAILNVIAKEKYIFDFVLGLIFIIVGILYFVKYRKDNINKL